jgi:glucan 1,3-beta-glucosidase
VGVWSDLHGAPGSQNGFDNSGQRDVINWQKGDNIIVTLRVLTYMAQKYGAADYSDVVTGIGLLNEPFGWKLDMNGVKQFRQDSFNVVRNATSNIDIVVHDAFQPLGYRDNLMMDANYSNVILTPTITNTRSFPTKRLQGILMSMSRLLARLGLE